MGANIKKIYCGLLTSLLTMTISFACYSQESGYIPSKAKRADGPHLALKTNLLYWAALTPNVELEYYFAPRWSVNLEGQLAWWGDKGKHKFYRLASVSPEFRYWIANKQTFKGHFVGVYMGTGIYEFMRKAEHGIQGDFYIAGGLSYGYSMPIGKRLRMELSLGVGYLQTDYKEYKWLCGCYVYERTKRQTYIGPTKAKVTLTYPLWWFNAKQKGGRR